MVISTSGIAHVLLAFTVLIVAAHVAGQIFERLRQPAVIGEIFGGLLLGPSVLGLVAPDATRALFPQTGITATVLAVVQELGLLLLMFLTGAEIRGRVGDRGVRTVATVAANGLLLPFGVGIGIVAAFGAAGQTGPAGTPLTYGLVFGIALAITGIPITARLLMDLGMIHTPFARTVLSIAVIDDIVLYALLAVVLGLTRADGGESFGLWALIGSDSVPMSAVYAIITPTAFCVLALTVGPCCYRRLVSARINVIERARPTAFRLVFLLIVSMVRVALGIHEIFGALLAGACAAGRVPSRSSSRSTSRSSASTSMSYTTSAPCCPNMLEHAC